MEGEAWHCVPERWVGFVFAEDNWQSASADNLDHSFFVRVRKRQFEYRTKPGPFVRYCTNTLVDVSCGTPGSDLFRFNFETMRFSYFILAGYLDSTDMGPSVAVGACSLVPE